MACFGYIHVPVATRFATSVPPSRIYVEKDANGKEILDFTSGQMSSILGHSHPAIVEVVKDSVSNLDHLLTSFISEPVADLAHNLCALLPDPLDKTFFLNTGSEVNEAAIKIAKCSTGKFEIIAFSSSYRKARACLDDSPTKDALERMLNLFDNFSPLDAQTA